MKNRSRTEIIASILHVINKRGSTRTKIMYGAFLSYTQLNEYLSFMDQMGLIKYDKDDEHASSNYIVITEKGIHYLNIHDRITQMITTIQVK
jgi:predicted transcriptional regulator